MHPDLTTPDPPPGDSALRDRLSTAFAGRFVLGDVIGEGGTAVVFAAHELASGRKVAIKSLRLHLVHTTQAQRFRQECAALSRLMHPGILPILDAGESQGVPWYAMPRASGSTLGGRIREAGPLAPDEALRIAADIADALAYAHEQGIVHRDLKPDNILLAGERALLADFGLAHVPDGDAPTTFGSAADPAAPPLPSRLTIDGQILGTAEYISPEQAAGGSATPRSDLYSLGCVLYEMLAGQPPYQAATARAVFGKHISAPVPAIGIDRPDLPVELQRLTARLLAKSPADRPASAREVLRDLDRIRGAIAEPAGTSTRSGGRPVTSRLGRYVLPVALVAGTGVALAAVGEWWAGARANPAATWPVTSVAVLPFDDLTSESKYGWLTEGLSNELTDALASIPQLDVRSFEAVRGALADGGARDSLPQRLRVGTFVSGNLASIGDSLTLAVRVADASGGRAIGTAIRASAHVSRADSLRFQLVEMVAVELRKRVGSRLDVSRPPERGRTRESWELHRRAESASRQYLAAVAAGRGRQANGDFRLADSLFARIMQRDPGWESPRVGRGWLYVHHARFVADTNRNRCTSMCERWLRGALALLPTEGALTTIGRELRAAIRLELAQGPAGSTTAPALTAGALQDVEAVLREDSTRARSWVMLATMRARAGDPQGAVSALRSAERADPWMTFEPEVLERLGGNLRTIGSYDEAARICELGRLRYPERATFQQCRLFLLGERGRGRGDISRAWNEFFATTRDIPDTTADVTWWYRRSLVAAVIARTGLRDSAYAVLRQSRVMRPTDDPNLLVQEAFVSVQLADTATAVARLSEYLQRVPQHAERLAREPRFRPLHGSRAFDSLLTTHGVSR